MIAILLIVIIAILLIVIIAILLGNLRDSTQGWRGEASGSLGSSYTVGDMLKEESDVIIGQTCFVHMSSMKLSCKRTDRRLLASSFTPFFPLAWKNPESGEDELSGCRHRTWFHAFPRVRRFVAPFHWSLFCPEEFWNPGCRGYVSFLYYDVSCFVSLFIVCIQTYVMVSLFIMYSSFVWGVGDTFLCLCVCFL